MNGISAMLEILTVYFCIRYMYEKGIRRFGIYDVVFLVCEIGVMQLANYFSSGKLFVIIGYFMIFIYQYLKYRSRYQVICTNTLILVCVIVVFQLLCSLPFTFLEGRLSVEMIVLISNGVMLAIMIVLGRSGILWNASHYMIHREWLSNVCSICCLIGSIYIIIVYKMTEYFRYTDYIIFAIWTILIYILLLKWRETKGQYLAKEKELEAERIYDEYAEALLKSVLKKQHDFDNHLQALSGSLDSEHMDYLNNLMLDNHYNKLLAGKDRLIVGFLYSKFVEAENEGCRIVYNVKLGDMKCTMPKYRIVQCIGILLDNAIEAVSDKEEKEIYVEVTEGKEDIWIIVRNPYEYVEQVKIQSWLKEGYSEKGINRGMGLSNLMAIKDEYNATLSIFNTLIDGRNEIEFKMVLGKDSGRS